MNFVVLADDTAFEILKQTGPENNWVQVYSVAAFAEHISADAFFDLSENAVTNEHPVSSRPVFINSVTQILPVDKKAVRINGWNGFLQNDTWEVAGQINEKEKAVLAALHKKVIACADEPGFISARIIAMIINEAYFAKGESVSSEAEIDTAMKLGTNYPYGPFEWAEKIGIKNIYALLEKLSLQDKKYQPSPLLIKTVKG